MSEKARDHAGVIAPPPLIVFGVLVGGLIINYVAPIAFLPQGVNLIVGAVPIALGLALGIAAIATMFRAGTSPEPHQSVRALVTNGPFRITRNPIYLGFALMYLGVCAAFNALAALALFPLAMAIIHFGVILREEKYLEAKFGDEYLRYKMQVRRWI